VTGLGLAAVLAANQVTLLLAWAGLDLFELFIWLSRSEEKTLREKVVLAFASRAAGIMVSLWGAGNIDLYFVAVLLRLGVIPFHVPYLEGTVMRRGLGTVLRIVPAVTTFPFLVNLASFSDLQVSEWIFPALTVVALFASGLWIMGKNELEARPFWVIVTSTMVLISTLQNSAEAVISWGVILALSGGILFLGRTRNRFWMAVYMVQVIFLSGMAFSPLWNVVRVYGASISLWDVLLLFAHSLLVGGYIRYMMEKPTQPLEGEPWIRMLYAIGLLLFPLIQCLVGYGDWAKFISLGTEYRYISDRTIFEYGIGFAVLVLLSVLWLMRRTKLIRFSPQSTIWYQILSFEWMFPLVQWIFRNVGSLVLSVYSIFEGEGGILWTILLIVLFSGFIILYVSGG
jgi:hypothetical protein